MKIICLSFALITTMITCLLLNSCSNKAKPFEWLVGTWEMNRSAGGNRLEIWSPHTDVSLAGKGLRISEGDTTMLETIDLVYRDKEYFYIARVPDQNNGNPIEFKLVKTEGTTYTFENPNHDFPQRIVYKLKTIAEQTEHAHPADSLLVRVEGLMGTELNMDLQGVKNS